MSNENIYYDVLNGRTANFIGDSLFGGHGIGKENTWIALLAQKYGMTHNNYGSNGCTLSACEGGANPIINRYVEMEDNNPDFVVFEGGRNDYNKCAALGSIEEGDITTYVGAVSKLIEGLRNKYPGAVIIGVSFWRVGDRQNAAGYECGVYTAAMGETCRSLGVPFIDATDVEESGVNMRDAEFRAKYCWVPGDVCHLNVEGMKLALPFFERKIADILKLAGL